MKRKNPSSQNSDNGRVCIAEDSVPVKPANPIDGAQTEFAAGIDFQNRADIFSKNGGTPVEFFIAER